MGQGTNGRRILLGGGCTTGVAPQGQAGLQGGVLADNTLLP
ncbi:hypothetical protein ACFVUH_16740 [Kitasatospora sp. NPDC058032]